MTKRVPLDRVLDETLAGKDEELAALGPASPPLGECPMRKTFALMVAAPLLLGLAACSDVSTGQVLGGVGGAAVGAQFGQGSGKALTTAAGAILGTLAGGYVERKTR